MSTTDAIVIDDVSHKYRGGTHALNELSLTIPMGKTTGVLGPNGSGKTTLLSLLSRQRRIQSGRIYAAGAKTWGDIRIGWGSSEAPLYEDIRFRPFVEKAMGPGLGLTAAESAARCRELLTQLRFEADADKQPSRMSRGMRVKASLVLAFLERPDVAILDEPFVGLDVASVDSMMDLVRQSRAAGMTMVVADHQVGVLDGALDYVAFIHDGRIIAQDNAQTLVSQHGSMLNAYRSVFGLAEQAPADTGPAT